MLVHINVLLFVEDQNVIRSYNLWALVIAARIKWVAWNFAITATTGWIKTVQCLWSH